MNAFIEGVYERLGKWGLFHVMRVAERMGPGATWGDFRDALRRIGVFVADEAFDGVIRAAPAGGVSAAAAAAAEVSPFGLPEFAAALHAKLSQRRRHVVDLVLAKLDPDKTGVIPFHVMEAAYDTARHPECLAGRLDVDTLRHAFLSKFTEMPLAVAPGEEGHAVVPSVTRNELVAFYTGISCHVAKDTDFEVLLIRSWELDRVLASVIVPRGTMATASTSSGRRSPSKMMLQLPLHARNVNPLLTTTSMDYGKGVEEVKWVPSKHGLRQGFTRNAAPTEGGSTTMNM